MTEAREEGDGGALVGLTGGGGQTTSEELEHAEPSPKQSRRNMILGCFLVTIGVIITVAREERGSSNGRKTMGEMKQIMKQGKKEPLRGVFCCIFFFGMGTLLYCSYDYSGYGASRGKPSEFNTYYDIEAVCNCLKSEYGIKQEYLILYGNSVGSGPTLHLASKLQKLRGVVLHSAILSR